jgi:hypothetical protein
MPGILRNAVLFIGLVGAAIAAETTPQARAQTDPSAAFERCRSIPDTAARLRCYEAAAPRHQPQAAPLMPGGWRLVRTPGPPGEKDAVSLMHTVDTARSDLGLAGLMLRCAEHGADVLVVMVAPLPPRAQPQVTLRAGGEERRFPAKVTPPGAALLLPGEAQALLAGPWQAEPELAIEVLAEGTATRGAVPLAGLRTAMAGLTASCAAR